MGAEDKDFGPVLQMDLTSALSAAKKFLLTLGSLRMLLKYHFSLLGNFGVFFLAILKTNMFSHHLSKRKLY